MFTHIPPTSHFTDKETEAQSGKNDRLEVTVFIRVPKACLSLWALLDLTYPGLLVPHDPFWGLFGSWHTLFRAGCRWAGDFTCLSLSVLLALGATVTIL